MLWLYRPVDAAGDHADLPPRPVGIDRRGRAVVGVGGAAAAHGRRGRPGAARTAGGRPAGAGRRSQRQHRLRRRPGRRPTHPRVHRPDHLARRPRQTSERLGSDLHALADGRGHGGGRAFAQASTGGDEAAYAVSRGAGAGRGRRGDGLSQRVGSGRGAGAPLRRRGPDRLGRHHRQAARQQHRRRARPAAVGLSYLRPGRGALPVTARGEPGPRHRDLQRRDHRGLRHRRPFGPRRAAGRAERFGGLRRRGPQRHDAGPRRRGDRRADRRADAARP